MFFLSFFVRVKSEAADCALNYKYVSVTFDSLVCCCWTLCCGYRLDAAERASDRATHTNAIFLKQLLVIFHIMYTSTQWHSHMYRQFNNFLMKTYSESAKMAATTAAAATATITNAKYEITNSKAHVNKKKAFAADFNYNLQMYTSSLHMISFKKASIHQSIFYS